MYCTINILCLFQEMITSLSHQMTSLETVQSVHSLQLVAIPLALDNGTQLMTLAEEEEEDEGKLRGEP